MYELDYYDNLKGAAVVPDEIKEFLDDGSKKSFGLDILLPSIRVLLYAASNENPFFSIIYEKLTKAKNLTSFFYERLKPNDLFDCLCLLGKECSYALLSKLNCPDSVLSKLHQTVLGKNLEDFKTVLEDGDINTSTITPICKLFHIRIRIDKFFIWFIENVQRVDEISDEERQYKEGKRLLRSAISNVQSFFKEIFYNDEDLTKIMPPLLDSTDSVINSAISPSENGFDNYSVISDHGIAEGVLIALTASHPNCKVEVSSMQEFFDFIFRMMLFLYYSLKEDALVSPTTLDVLREIVFVPEYESIWGKYETANGIDLLSQDLDAFSEKIMLNEEQSTPQIGEPVTRETEEGIEQPRIIKNRGGGRPRESWIKGRPGIKEEDVGSLIERDIWRWLVDEVGKLKFRKGIAGKTKETQIKNFGAGLVYYAAEKIGWAKVYTNHGIQSSFMRTMAFADISRTSFEKEIQYLHEWYHEAEQYKEHIYQFDSCYDKHKEDDKNRAFLIFQNVDGIGKIIEKLKEKLCATLDGNCKL